MIDTFPTTTAGSFIQYTLLSVLLLQLSLRAFLIFSETNIIPMIIPGQLWQASHLFFYISMPILLALNLRYFFMQIAKFVRPLVLGLILSASHARTFSLINGYGAPLEAYKILEHYDDVETGMIYFGVIHCRNIPTYLVSLVFFGWLLLCNIQCWKKVIW